jgi:hypothetical protein
MEAKICGMNPSDFISYWDTNSSDMAIKLKDNDFNKKITACATYIVANTQQFAQKAPDWDQLEIFEYQIGKFQEIFSKLGEVSDSSVQGQKQALLALCTLMKCSHAFLKFKKMSEEKEADVNAEQVQSLCSVFKEALRLMFLTHPNPQSDVYPQIRQILMEFNSIAITGMIHQKNEWEAAILNSFLALLSLPVELIADPAFHMRAFFQAIEQLAQAMSQAKLPFTQEEFRLEFQKFLRFYAEEVLSGAENKKFIWRKSSAPNFYTHIQDGKMNVRYLSVAASIKINNAIVHTVFYYDKLTKEWVGSGVEAESAEQLDRSFDRYKTFAELKAEVLKEFTGQPETSASQGTRIAGKYIRVVKGLIS